MVIGLRIVLSLLGLLCLFMGMSFLIDPAGAGGDFGLEAPGPQGLSSIRGDLTAFFWVSGGSLILGAWRGDATLLYVAAALMGIVFMGRVVGLSVDGTYEGWFAPMIAEAVMVTAALIGTRVLVRR